MSQQQSRHSHRWLAILMAGIGIALAAVLTVSYLVIESHLKTNAGEALATLADSIEEQLDRLLSERAETLWILAEQLASQQPTVTTFATFLSRMHDGHRLFRWIAIADRQGRILAAATPTSIGQQIKNTQSVFAALRTKEVTIRDITATDTQQTGQVIQMATAIRDPQGTITGLLIAEIRIEAIRDIFDHTIETFQEHHIHGRVDWQLLDQQGLIIADSNHEGEGVINLFEHQLPSAIAVQHQSNGYIEESRARRQASVMTGYAQLTGGAPASALHWGILVRKDRQDIVAPLNAVISKAGIILALLFLPALYIQIRGTRRLGEAWTTTDAEAAASKQLITLMHRLTEHTTVDEILTNLLHYTKQLTPPQTLVSLGIPTNPHICSPDEERQATPHNDERASDREHQAAPTVGTPNPWNIPAHWPDAYRLQQTVPTGQHLIALPQVQGPLTPDGRPSPLPALHNVRGIALTPQNQLFGYLWLGRLQPDTLLTPLVVQSVITLTMHASTLIQNITLLTKLRIADARSHALLESTIDGVFGVDHQGHCTFINTAAATMLGYRPHELLGCPMPDTIRPQASPLPSDPPIPSPIIRAIEEGRTFRVDNELFTRRNGSTFPVHYSVSPIRNDIGGQTGAVVIFTDSTQRKEAEARLHDLAHFDVLTGLPNRRRFLTLLTKALARAKRQKQLVGLLFLDLDRFKDINDTLGHARADELLQAVATRFQSCARMTDTVARLAGDEFTIILEDLTTPADAEVVAKRFLDVMATPITLGPHDLKVSASIGIALSTPQDTVETILARADTAMYAAKDQRCTYQLYSPSMEAHFSQRLTIKTAIHRARERHQWLLHYQPCIDIRTGHVIGVEALLRWNHPDRGILLPDEFLPILEEEQEILAVGEWILRTACAQVKSWQEAGQPQLRLAVNLSPLQIHNGRLPDQVKTILAETRLPSESLTLEIPERLFHHHHEPVISTLQALHNLRVQLTIEDYGTGPLSLQLLKELPISQLKLDRSLLEQLPSHRRAQAVLKTIMATATFLGFDVCAEGVETTEQAKWLYGQRCFLMQGFYFSHPLPPDSLKDTLNNRMGSFALLCAS